MLLSRKRERENNMREEGKDWGCYEKERRRVGV